MPEFTFDWRGRDELVVDLAMRHVVCIRHFFPHFPSKQTTYRRIKRLQEQRQLRKVGEVMIQDSGRPEAVFCNGWKPKYDQLRHEVKTTDFLLLYPEADIVRGWQYVDQAIRADAEMTLRGIRFFVELDTGHESLGQVQKRQRVYRGVSEPVLYVTLRGSKRVEGLKRVSKAIEEVALFTTLDEVMKEPEGKVWSNRAGEGFVIAP